MRSVGSCTNELAAFRQALDDPAVDARDDFEARGGHSLRAIRLCGILHQATGRRVSVGDLYRHPTPLDLARHLRQQQGRPPPPRWTPPELELDTPAAAGGGPRTPARTVLVTGATGSLGAALVDALLRATSVEVAALVRADDEDHARRRLAGALERHGAPGPGSRNHESARQGVAGRSATGPAPSSQEGRVAPGDLARPGSAAAGRRLAGALERHDASGLGSRDPGPRLQAIPGDLSKPRMGLTPDAFSSLAERVDAVLHLAADLDAFASYTDLEPANVGGTREVLRLAFRHGAPVHHVSSSAVFPLETSWPEETFGLQAMHSLGADLEASGADGYSLSKLGAELLLWSAFERGLPVSVVRVPHLVSDSGGGDGGPRDRLTSAVRALAAAGVFPEGDWFWQLAPVDAVCRELVSLLETGPPPGRPVRHLTLEPLDAAEILEGLRSRGLTLESLSLPALASALIAAAQGGPDLQAASGDPGSRDVCAAAQLIHQHGPRAALNLADARLLTKRPLPGNPASLFFHSTGRHAERAPLDEP